MEPLEGIDENQAEELAAKVKIILLTVALAGLYDAHFGGFTSIELNGIREAVRKGKGILPASDSELEKSLVIGIETHLAMLPEAEAEKMWKAVCRYIDSKPDLQGFFDIKDAYKVLYKITSSGDALPMS